MRVGELARRTGVGVATVRAWERRFGFLHPERSSGGQRLYTEADVERVSAVRRLVTEGLTLPAAVDRVTVAGSGALPTGEGETLLLRRIVEVVDEGIWVFREGRTRFANRRMAELMGCSVDDLLGRPVLDFLDPQVVPQGREREELRRAGRRLHYEIELRRLDGSTFEAEVSNSPMHDRAGHYEGAVAVVRDVTARNEADREARFRAALLDSIGEAVAAATPDGTLVYVNPAAERLFGWRAADVIGKDGTELMPSRDALDDAQLIHSRLQEGVHYSGNLRMARRDGTTFAAHFTHAPIVDNAGKLVGLIAVIHDLTERIGLDDDLRTRELQLETVALLGAHALRRGLGPERAAGAVLTEALEAIRRVLPVDHAMLLEIAPNAPELAVRAASPPTDNPGVVPAGSRSLAGYTAMARKVVIVGDVSTDRRFDLTPAQTTSGIVSAIAAPVFGSGGVHAILIAERSRPHAFDQAAVHFMQSMANVIGAALQATASASPRPE
jgi:PAS domain S-box-containing protein